MSNKMDRQGSRTPADLEYRYYFGKTFAEIMGVATDARNIAENVQKSYEGLNQDEIFKRLTNNGTWQGVYYDGNDMYINASYIRSGTIKSANYTEVDGKVTLGMSIDLDDSIINSPKFKLNNLGEIIATGGEIGGFELSEDRLTKTAVYTGNFARTCNMLVSPQYIGTETQITSGDGDKWYSAGFSDGLLQVRTDHAAEYFDGTLAYYMENGGTYRVFIDADTNTVRAEISSPPLMGG